MVLPIPSLFNMKIQLSIIIEDQDRNTVSADSYGSHHSFEQAIEEACSKYYTTDVTVLTVCTIQISGENPATVVEETVVESTILHLEEPPEEVEE